MKCHVNIICDYEECYHWQYPPVPSLLLLDYSVFCFVFVCFFATAQLNQLISPSLLYRWQMMYKYVNKIAMKFDRDIHHPQRMNPSDFGDARRLTFFFCFLVKYLKTFWRICHESLYILTFYHWTFMVVWGWILMTMLIPWSFHLHRQQVII